MSEVKLTEVTLDGFLKQLSANTWANNPVKRGKFVNTAPERAPWSYRIHEKEILSRGRTPLTQYRDSYFSGGNDESVGYIDSEHYTELESGTCPASRSQHKLVFTEPILLTDRRVIPACSATLTVLSKDKSLVGRIKGKVKLFPGLWWPKKDITTILPEQWFYGNHAEGYIDGNITPEDEWAELDAEFTLDRA